MGQFFKNLFSRFLGFGKQLAAFLAPIVAKHGAELLNAALPIALDIVSSFETRGGDGETKRAAAVDRLRETLHARGVAAAEDLSASTLNWIVETALQKLRASAS